MRGEFCCVFGYSTSFGIAARICMATVEKTVLVERSAEQMFELVDRVENYPVFLPWCGGASVVHKGENVVHATVHINFHHIKQTFTTENVRCPPHRIDMKLQDGPFRHLDGSWHFIPLNETACKIEFRLHYEFSSKLLEKLVGPVFHMIANSFVDAFIQRAENIYS
jgi:ribosome-associated toxin RatA of RatAB toxin-antitoxin module